MSSASLWHKMLGLIPYNILQWLKFCKRGSNNVFIIPRGICSISKQKRLPFPQSQFLSSNAFELIHLDLWSSDKVVSPLGVHYILPIVNDNNRATWTFLLHQKSETFHTVSIFLQLVTQYQAQVKLIRTVNGSEFVNHDLKTRSTRYCTS